jgi:hypothetical protein
MTGCEPDSSTVYQSQSSESTSLSGVQLGAPHRSGSNHSAALSHFVCNCGIHVPAITRHAPLDTAMLSSLAYARLPKNLSALIRIECVNNAGFLACHK